MAEKQKRNFVITSCDDDTIENDFGNFTGASPLVAAKKAAARIFKDMANTSPTLKQMFFPNSKNKITFCIRETTRGAKNAGKLLKYTAEKIVLDPPKEVMIAGKKIVYNFMFDVKAVKEAGVAMVKGRVAKPKVVKPKVVKPKVVKPKVVKPKVVDVEKERMKAERKALMKAKKDLDKELAKAVAKEQRERVKAEKKAMKML